MSCPRCGAELKQGHVCPSLLSQTMPMPDAAVPSADAVTEPAAELAASDAQTRLAIDPTLPDVVGGYRLGYAIGSGGSSTVYQASRGGERVAVKVARRGSSDEATITRALREAKASARAHHPNVLEVLSTGLLPDGRPYLVSELLDGQGLDVLLAAHGRLPLAAAVAVLDDVAAALEATHAQGIVHRDLKPANVFIATGRDGVRAKVIDFGIALLGEPGAATPQTNVARVPGTAEYSSPEQARGAALDAASDLYSLGVLAFELVTGRLPFSAESSTGVLRLHAAAAAPTLSGEPGVPAPLARLIDALLAKDAAVRPPAATAVRAALAQVEAAGEGQGGLLAELVASWAARNGRPRGSLWQRVLSALPRGRME